MNLFHAGEGNTAVSPEEQLQLIPNLSTKEELNEWERSNILIAYDWALDSRMLKRREPLSEAYVRELHRRMFDQTWKWAGVYRRTEKNIGIPHYEIMDALGGLLGDVRWWVKHGTFSADEITVRLHHRLVFIHPFCNGNGRHARLMADVVAKVQDRPLFSWGGASKLRAGEVRKSYIDALRCADRGDITLLLAFVRS